MSTQTDLVFCDILVTDRKFFSQYYQHEYGNALLNYLKSLKEPIVINLGNLVTVVLSTDAGYVAYITDYDM